jgi:predicted peptidase
MRKLSFLLIVATILLCVQAPLFSMQAPAAQTPQPPQPSPTAPLYQAKGEQYRIYNFPGTGESIPYRLFVPSRWTPNTKLPLLVSLRAGNTVDGPYRENNDLVKVGEQRGYIVVTPMGYRGLSQPYYGSTYPIVRPNGPSTPAAGWTAQENERSEQDVMYVIDLVAKEYNVDAGRIFIHGQNPSGSGALYLAAKYPDKFAGVIVSSGPIPPAMYPWDRIKGKMGMLVIHGDADTTNPIEASKAMADAAKAAGVDVQFAVVPTGTHLGAFLTYANGFFDFMDKHKK